MSNLWADLYTTFTNHATTYAQWMIYWDSTTLAENQAITIGHLDNLIGTYLITAKIFNDTGTMSWAMRYYDNGGAHQLNYSTTSPASGQWYIIKLQYTISADAGIAAMWVGTTKILEATGLATDSFTCRQFTVGAEGYACTIFNDQITVADADISPPSDSTPPTIIGLTYNTTKNASACKFEAQFEDNIALSFYIFSTNNTGPWLNETAIIFITNPQTVAVTKTLNETVGNVVSFKWFGNDTTNNWNLTSVQNFTLTSSSDTTSPTINYITKSTTSANASCIFQCQISDDTALAYYIYSTNNTGQWLNDTRTAFTTNPQTISVTKTLNDTVGVTVSFKWYANDTLNNNVTSATNSFQTTEAGIPVYTSIAASGLYSDIQIAVNDVHTNSPNGTGNVIIPSGIWNFTSQAIGWHTVTIPAGVSVFGAPNSMDGDGMNTGWDTVLVMNFSVAGDPYGTWTGTPQSNKAWFMIQGTSDPNMNSRISDICFNGYRCMNTTDHTLNLAIYVDSVINYRIDHCFFNNTGAGGVYAIGMYCCGVTDHTKFVNNPAIVGTNEAQCDVDYGFSAYRKFSGTFNELWDNTTTNVVGHYTIYTHFVEDCYFERWRHASSANDGAHYVFRYNTVNNSYAFGEVDAHGTYNTVGTRALEIYNNTFLNNIGGDDFTFTAVNWRGGAGVCFNNTQGGGYHYIQMIAEGGVEECWPHDVYVWSNSLSFDLTTPASQTGSDSQLHPQLGLDFFLTAMSGYVAYTYPHPLTNGVAPSYYTITVTIANPENTTYLSATSISVSLSASGGTIDKIWWNLKNGTDWVYVSNQTYTVPTSMTGIIAGTSYTFYAWANSTLGINGVTIVSFSVYDTETTTFIDDWGGYWGRWWGYP